MTTYRLHTQSKDTLAERRKQEQAKRREAARALVLRIEEELKQGQHRQRLATVAASLPDLQRFSPLNQVLILLQRPTATQVADYAQWQQRGRQVYAQAHGIVIRVSQQKRDTKPPAAIQLPLFAQAMQPEEAEISIAYVYDISQTVLLSVKKP